MKKNTKRTNVISKVFKNKSIPFLFFLLPFSIQTYNHESQAQSEADTDLIWMNLQGKYRDPANDRIKMITEIENLVENGYAPATIFLARIYGQKKDGRLSGKLNDLIAKALPKIREGIRQGNHQAHLALSLAYRFGYGVEKNDLEKTRLLEVPLKVGNPQALEWLISDFAKGSGVPQSLSLALDITYQYLEYLTKYDFDPQLGLLSLLFRDFSAWDDADKEKIYYIMDNYDPKERTIYSIKKFIHAKKNNHSSAVIYNNIDLSVFTILSGGDLSNYPSEGFSEFNKIETHQFEIYNCGKKFPLSLHHYMREIPIDTKDKQLLAARISCHLDADSPLFSPDEFEFHFNRHKQQLAHYAHWVRGLQKLYHPQNDEDKKLAHQHLKQGVLNEDNPIEKIKYYLIAKILDDSGELEEAKTYYLKSGEACFTNVIAAKDGKYRIRLGAAADPSEGVIEYYYEPGLNPMTGFFTMDTDIAAAQCAEIALSRALELGEAKAGLYLALLPTEAKGTLKRTPEQKMKLLEKAVNAGVMEAYAPFALIKIKSGDMSLSERLTLYDQLKFSAEAGDLPSKHALYSLISDSDVFDAGKSGLAILREAAEKRHRQSQLLLGKKLVSEENKIMQEEGLHWLEESLANGDVEAGFEIAVFERNNNANRNEAQILQRLYLAAQQGVLGARQALAEAIENGDGLEAPSPWLASIWRTGKLP